MDTILGKGRRQAVLTLTERKSGFLRKVDRRTAELVSNAVINLLQPVADRLHTITGNNGKEFTEHEHIAQELGIDFFFAHPYAAWERGTNENMNGLVRQYIPKKQDLTTVTNDDLEEIMIKLNHRLRKCLDFISPFEVFFEQFVALTS